MLITFHITASTIVCLLISLRTHTKQGPSVQGVFMHNDHELFFAAARLSDSLGAYLTHLLLGTKKQQMSLYFASLTAESPSGHMCT